MDCAAAREFFLANDVELQEYDVTASEEVRQRMMDEFGRVATPAIVIGRRVFWGFEDNKQDIADLLGIRLGEEAGNGAGSLGNGSHLRG